MPWSEFVRDLVDVADRVALVGSIGGGLALVGLKLAGRRTPRQLGSGFFGVVGLLMGTTILGSAGQPLVRVVLLVGLVTGFLLCVQARHQEWGGSALILAGLPIALTGIAEVFDAAALGLTDVSPFVPTLALGVFTTVSGFVFIEGAAVSARKLALPAGDRPWNAASTVLLGRTWLGLNRASWAAMAGSTAVTLVAVVMASGRGVIETIAAVVVGGIASAVVAAILWAVSWPTEDRAAYEAIGWIGELETRRIRALAGPIAMTIEGMIRFMRNTAEQPGDRWFRAEILAIDGQLELAREVAERIPLDRPLAAIDRAANLAYIDWLGGGPADLSELRAVVEAVPAGLDERVIGEAAVATMLVRQLVGGHDPDPAAPMRAFRQLVGSRADGQLWVTARRGLPGQFRVAVAMIAILTVADHALVG